MTLEDWSSAFTRADGSHMTQMDVDGGRTLTIERIEVIPYDRKTRTALVHWREDVLPWLMPQQEGLLLQSMGWRPADAVGRRLYLYRDPDVMFGNEKVGGSRIGGSPDVDCDRVHRWRCGKRKLQRKVHKSPDPDPLWGLVVVRWRMTLAQVDQWALSKGLAAAPSSLTGEARAKIAQRLDTDENRAAVAAFNTQTVEEAAQ